MNLMPIVAHLLVQDNAQGPLLVNQKTFPSMKRGIDNMNQRFVRMLFRHMLSNSTGKKF